MGELRSMLMRISAFRTVAGNSACRTHDLTSVHL